jgi:hypothetical protein
MIFYDYRDGLDFYEQLRPSITSRLGVIKIYATGAAIVQNSGLLHFLEKFKRKGFAPPRIQNADLKIEAQSHHGIESADTQELVYLLAGMMQSAGELHGISKFKDHSRASSATRSPLYTPIVNPPSI